MLIKIHTSYRKVAAICDTDLIGKTFEEGNQSIFINPNFFKGDEKSQEEILKDIDILGAEDATFNFVGKESVDTALKAGVIKQEGIREIQGVPIALVLL